MDNPGQFRTSFLVQIKLLRHLGSTRPRTVRLRRSDATVRIGGTMAIPAVLRSLGANPAEVLAEAGFDLKLFDDPDNLVSYAARNRLMAHCAARTGCPHFGLLVGQQGGPHSLGLVGLLVKYSPDVGAALRNLVRYSHLHVRGAVATLAVDGHSATLGYEIYQSHGEVTDQVGDAAVAVMFNIMRALCGSDWKPVEIRFAHRKPKDVGPFRRFFRTPLVFDAEENAVVFSADWLNRRLPEVDPELHRLLQKQIDALEVRHGEDLPEQLRSVLRTALVTGHASVDRSRRTILDAPPHLESPPQWLRHKLQGACGRVSLRGRPADAQGLGDGDERDRCVAGLCRRERLHAGVPALERHDSGSMA